MEDISRRTLFAGLCAITVSGISSLPAAAATAVKKLKDGKLAVTVKSVPELATKNGTVSIGTIKGKPVGVTRTGTNTYVAFSLACPHQGVTVVKGDGGWVCPAHLSKFEADGDLILGPSTTKLPRIPAKLSRGVLTVG